MTSPFSSKGTSLTTSIIIWSVYIFSLDLEIFLCNTSVSGRLSFFVRYLNITFSFFLILNVVILAPILLFMAFYFVLFILRVLFTPFSLLLMSWSWFRILKSFWVRWRNWLFFFFVSVLDWLNVLNIDGVGWFENILFRSMRMNLVRYKERHWLAKRIESLSNQVTFFKLRTEFFINLLICHWWVRSDLSIYSSNDICENGLHLFADAMVCHWLSMIVVLCEHIKKMMDNKIDVLTHVVFPLECR